MYPARQLSAHQTHRAGGLNLRDQHCSSRLRAAGHAQPLRDAGKLLYLDKGEDVLELKRSALLLFFSHRAWTGFQPALLRCSR